LYLFAAMIKLQREPAGPDVIRVPGGGGMAKLVAVLGFATTAATIALSLVPPPDDPNKPLAVLKILGGTAALVLVGAGIYAVEKRKQQQSKT
jgi:glutamate:GABA antiporter